MTINEFLQETNYFGYGGRPRVHCADGFSVSVQASQFHYCRPRIDNADKYEAVELEYPSAADDLITDYAEDCAYTDTVYGYVPVEIVDKLIEKHGGIYDVYLNLMKIEL